jgi:dolichyl-phosphate-mannose-protein mannosyltransferase
MFVKKILKHQLFLIFSIFFFALAFRLYGLNWDQNQHLHPDERFLTMLTTTIEFPKSINQYFDTKNSPLNPFNYDQFKFFVYGTFPVFLVKSLGQIVKLNSYQDIHFVGRVLSAIFDSLNIFSLYFLSLLLFSKKKKYLSFLPSLFYAFTVLPIQLSHFFTIDTFLSFFILLSFVLFSYWIKKRKLFFLLLASFAFGLAFSCKISAILFSPIILFFFIYQIFQKKSFPLKELFLFLFVSFFVFRFFQPYSFIGLFKINPDLISSLNYLKSILMNRNVFYPPEIQWLSKTLIIYPLQNIVFWGLGIPISILLFLSFKNVFSIKLKKIFSSPKIFIIFLSIFWTLFLFIEQGLQFTHTMRYFLPIYPFVCFLAILLNLSCKNCLKIFTIIFIFHLLYSLSFVSIYTRPHSRIQASNWIYENISLNSILANEYWDDPLPLPTQPKLYSIKMLSLYDPDTESKWTKINLDLSETNYLFLTSNRLWSSISSVPDRYPISSKYYQDLFDGKSEFQKRIEFNSYPGISIPFIKKCIYLGPTNYPYLLHKNNWLDIDDQCLYPGIYLRDDTAEEAFSVYDHPKVIIFQK